jgi:sterol desaturase/sphingolipid hydroxylase (fatty acid hydroxylase superfamily)
MTTLTIVAAAALLMIAVEWRFPRRQWPQRELWWLRASLAIVVQGAVAFTGAMTWDRILPNFAPWRIDGLGTLSGALVGYVVITFIYYWWHRARHASDTLWLVFHQVHHSPARLELAATFYKHPLEILVNGLLSSAILALLVGATPAQSTLAVTLTGIAELFYHWNVKTPYWLGFVIQRPESHCLHHARDRHDCNFADLPIWDMLFGTFENPRTDVAVCGFEDAEERRWRDLLLARPVGRRADGELP